MTPTIHAIRANISAGVYDFQKAVDILQGLSSMPRKTAIKLIKWEPQLVKSNVKNP